jgi:hypothetical protein
LVFVKPGDTAFTLTFVPSSSMAIATVIAFIAAFDAEYPSVNILR